jgi:preprotein translocase subunit YajC
MFISEALAQTAETAAAAPATMGTESALAQFLPLIVIFVIFYFMLIRPQQKKMKEHQAMLGALRKGDRVVTAGGIFGTVIKVEEGDEVLVEIATGVTVRAQKSSLGAVLSKSEPVA